MIFFQGQGKVSEYCFGSVKFGILLKVREKSVNIRKTESGKFKKAKFPVLLNILFKTHTRYDPDIRK